MTSEIIAVLSGIMFMSFCIALMFVMRRVLRHSVPTGSLLLLLLVFVSSPFFVMSSHLLGYFDGLLYILTIVSVALTLANRPFLAATIQVVALLSHETYLLIGFPFVCMTSVLMRKAPDRSCTMRRHVAALAIVLLAFGAILIFQSILIDRPILRQQLTVYLVSFDFIATRSRDVAIFQTTDFFEFLKQHWALFIKRSLDPIIMSSVVPSLLSILYFAHSSIRLRTFSPVSLLLLAAVFCPLAMHAVAFDTGRISTYTLCGAFIGLWILTEFRKTETVDDLFTLIAIPALLLNIFMRLPLMDSQVERFSDTARLLVYSPALLLALAVVMKRRTS